MERRESKNENLYLSDISELLNNVRLISHNNITVSEEGKIYGNWVRPNKCRART
jgi:hypothetical protein